MRKNRAIVLVPEVLPPELPDSDAKLHALVEQKISEIMDKNSADALFEPFFRTQAIANEIRRRQTVTEQRKWTRYYEKWGCLVCGKRDRPHSSCGMCRGCRAQTNARLYAILKEAESEQEARPVPVVRDLVADARSALQSVEQARAILLRERVAKRLKAKSGDNT